MNEVRRFDKEIEMISLETDQRKFRSKTIFFSFQTKLAFSSRSDL